MLIGFSFPIGGGRSVVFHFGLGSGVTITISTMRGTFHGEPIYRASFHGGPIYQATFHGGPG